MEGLNDTLGKITQKNEDEKLKSKYEWSNEGNEGLKDKQRWYTTKGKKGNLRIL